MPIELTQDELKVLLQILNQISISGVEQMTVVLQIVKKLSEAVKDDSGD